MEQINWNNEEKKNTPEKQIDDGVATLIENKEAQKTRNQQERVDKAFWDLEWKVFKKWDVIEFMYMSEEWETEQCKFDINWETIEYKGNKYNVELPKSATITEIKIIWNDIVMKGKVGWFSWEWSASQWDMLKALDEVFNKWYTIIASNWGNITISS